MLANYLKVVFRNLSRNLGYSVIKIAGLALGLACSILILLFVQYELNYDDFHENHDRIYRLTFSKTLNGVPSQYAATPAAAAPAFSESLPEITTYTRILTSGSAFINYENKKFFESGRAFTDTSFFQIFSFEFIHGDPSTALQSPHSIVLTESLARKIFGEKNPLGQIVNLSRPGDVKVTGVIKDIPNQSDFNFRYVLPMTILQQADPALLAHWLIPNPESFLLLSENTDPKDVQSKLATIVETHAGDQAAANGAEITFELQPLSDIHLYSEHLLYNASQGNITTIYLFVLIAIFILGIACINFMNLSTARASRRHLEIGIRKALGAIKGRLISQFLLESVIIAFSALLFAVFLVELILPTFNQMIDRDITFNYYSNWPITVSLIVLTILTGIFAGSYPALFMSALKPVEALKGKIRKTGSQSFFRKTLVVIQFSISIVLIICTVFMLNQINFMQEKKPGFAEEQLLVLRMRGVDLNQSQATFKNALLNHSGITGAAYSDGIPGEFHRILTIRQHGASQNETHSMNVIIAGDDFPDIYGLQLIEGRMFSPQTGNSNEETQFLINESAAELLGRHKNVIGKTLGYQGEGGETIGTVVGIVKDFHYESLHSDIEPLIIPLYNGRHRRLTLKIAEGNLDETMAFIETHWKAATTHPFNSFFVDAHFDALYNSEKRVSDTIVIFSFISIFIACLGLLGLSIYGIQLRIKEIGIRKVLGASIGEILILLSKDFTRWILLANFVAWPIAWFLVDHWLNNFAYRITIDWKVFLGAGCATLLIALITVGSQAIKAAISNPVKTLRHE